MDKNPNRFESIFPTVLFGLSLAPSILGLIAEILKFYQEQRSSRFLPPTPVIPESQEELIDSLPAAFKGLSEDSF